MRRKAFLPAAAVLIGLLTACALPLLTPDERKQLCQIVVDEKFGAPVFEPNVLSNPAGGLAGAGLGAMQGLYYGPNAAILSVPIGAVVGAIGGGICGVASLSHPTADADFAALLRAADNEVLARTLETEFNAPRAECSAVRANQVTAPEPDGMIEIDKVRVGMGCLFGSMEYWIAVDWRAVNARSKRPLAPTATATRCELTSFRNVDNWFAHPDQARAELEGALAATGHHMATQLLTQDVFQIKCRLQSDEAGMVKAR